MNYHFIDFESKTSINVKQIIKSRPKGENLRWVALVSYTFYDTYMNEKTWIIVWCSITSFWIAGVQIDLKSETEMYRNWILVIHTSKYEFWSSWFKFRIKVPRWEIFMEQELRFGLDLGRFALLKNYEQLFRPFFSSFQGRRKGIKIL